MALQNRDKISQIVMGIRQQERERQQAQGDAMDDGPDKLVHDLQKTRASISSKSALLPGRVRRLINGLMRWMFRLPGY